MTDTTTMPPQPTRSIRVLSFNELNPFACQELVCECEKDASQLKAVPESEVSDRCQAGEKPNNFLYLRLSLNICFKSSAHKTYSLPFCWRHPCKQYSFSCSSRVCWSDQDRMRKSCCRSFLSAIRTELALFAALCFAHRKIEAS